MAGHYKLNFSLQSVPCSGQINIYHSNDQSNATLQIYAFCDGTLYCYEYGDKLQTLEQKWKIALHGSEASTARILHFPKTLDDILMVKTSEGIDFYQYQSEHFNPLMRSSDFDENEFHDAYSWNQPNNIIKSGHFYHDRTVIGILTKHREYGVKFYAVMRSELLAGTYPIWPLETDLQILGNCSEADIYLSDLLGKGQENIVVHNRDALTIYSFNHLNNLESVMSLENSGTLDNSESMIFFPRVTDQASKDIVALNASGLFMYRYSTEQSNYIFALYSSRFAKVKGWNRNHTNSIQFEDIDLDGRQDLLFTGPEGIEIFSYSDFNNQWESWLNNFQLPIPVRHSTIMHVVPLSLPHVEYPIVFTHVKDQLRWASFVELDESVAEEVNLKSEETASQLPPPIRPQTLRKIRTEKAVTLLRDHLNCTSIVDSVDRYTGRVKFTLPLIELRDSSSDIKLDLFYDGNSRVSGVLGLGWSLPQNYIVLDHQSSIFSEDEKYYIVLNDVPQQLLLNSTRSTDNVSSFDLLSKQADVQIRYYRREEKWEIVSKGMKQTYGRFQASNSDAISWDLTWQNWRGEGSSSTGQKELATAWHIVETRDANNNMLRYGYVKDSASAPSGKSFTREIYLTSISDNQGSEIIFYYSAKSTSEYDTFPLEDEKGVLNTRKVQTRHISGYKFSTLSNTQVINFGYKVQDGLRLLIDIHQEDDITKEPIIQFDYQKMTNAPVLQKIILPTGAKVEFNYQLLGAISPITEKLGYRYDVPTNHRVNQVNGGILISYLTQQGQVALRIFNQEMTEEMYSSVSSTVSNRLPLLGLSSVVHFEVVHTDGFLAIILYYSVHKELCLLRKEDASWLTIPTYYRFNQDAFIKSGQDFIVTLNAFPYVELIEWNETANKWTKQAFQTNQFTSEKPLALSVFGAAFVVYDDAILWVGYKDGRKQWQSKMIKSISGVFHNVRHILEKFDLEDAQRNQILHHFRNNALQLSNNLILLHGWNAKEMQFESTVRLFTLNSERKIAQQQQYQVAQDDLTKYSKDDENDGTIFTFAYQLEQNRYKLIVKDFRGKILDNLHDEYKGNQKLIDEMKDKVREDALKSYGKRFILDLQKYDAVLSTQIAICGKMRFTFTGDAWTNETITVKNEERAALPVPLGAKLILDKENSQSSIKLYNQGSDGKKQGNHLADLKVYQLNQTSVSNLFPVYLAYQEKGKQAGVIGFSQNGRFNGIHVLPAEETLTAWCSHELLVTSIHNAFTDNSRTLIFRQQLGLKPLLPNAAVTEVKVYLNNESHRLTGFEYSSPKAYGDVEYYENRTLIPGNDKASFGWIEEHESLGNQSKSLRNIYDGRGSLVKSLKLTENRMSPNEQLKDEENIFLNTTSYDHTGKLEVAQFHPYEVPGEEVSYYGFEKYEINQIGATKSTNQRKWLFDVNDVVEEGFSFTGQNYLQLYSNNTLRGTFQPSDRNNDYIASCWMRPHSEIFELGAVTPYLKAIVHATNGDQVLELLSDIKFRVRNWFYFEVIVNILYAKQIYASFRENSTTIENPVANLSITIIVGPGVGTSIDIDHIRFSPLDSNFQATVYDAETKQVKEVINTNGLVKRNVYDKHQEQIAHFNEYGQLVELSSHSKASGIGRIGRLRSTILVQPESGFYEDFALFSFEKRWQIDNPDVWKISPGRLNHLSNSLHRLRYDPYEISTDSYGLRLNYVLRSENCAMKFGNSIDLVRIGDSAILTHSNSSRSAPLRGELLIVGENNRKFIWVDGGLYFDTFSKIFDFDLEMSGEVEISDVLIFSNPNVRVTYFNELDEMLQEIVLESQSTATVTEYLYDELGRQTITTQPVRMNRSEGQTLLDFYPTLVINGDPHSKNSVWKTDKIFGDISNVLSEYAYSRILYDNSPMAVKRAVGLPGKDFSVLGPYARRFSTNTEDLFINNQYPTNHNFSHQVEYKPGDVEDISVYDNKNNKVAWYVNVPGSVNLLCTYEYDDNDNVVLSLPPLYHDKVRNLQKPNSTLKSISEEQQTLRMSLGISTSYDQRGNIITKTTPDAGKVENVYDDSGLLKFIIFYSTTNAQVIENVVYFQYNRMGILSATGRLLSVPSKDELLSLELSESNSEEHQLFYQSDLDRDPLLRGKARRTITFNDGEPLVEESVLNVDKETVSKRIIIPMKGKAPVSIVINKQYIAGKLREMDYPVEFDGKPLTLTYSYNKLGKVTGIGISGKPSLLVSFAYNAVGQIASEQHLPSSNNSFTRHYSYNEPGFMTKLQDKFLTETIYYTSGSYGGHGYGDGTVTRTEFEATWHDSCDRKKLGLNEQSFVNRHISVEESALCFRELKQAGYLDENNHQSRVFYPALETTFPIVCSTGVTGRRIQKILGERGFPSKYGHSYDYGTQQELTKAKYFVGNEIHSPMQPETFANEIQGVNATVSYDIWRTLIGATYLIQDNARHNISIAHAKRGKSFVRSTLFGDLREANISYGGYKLHLEKLLTKVYYQRHNLSSIKSILQEAFINWNGSDVLQDGASEIIEMLETKQYLQSPMDEKFTKLLEKYKTFLPDVVRVLSEYFARQLGEAEFDVESYEIDANGNHKHYYTGFDRYNLSYRNNTNHVNDIKFKSYASSNPEHGFTIKHDSRGNIIQALHKGIEKIVYNPVSNSVTKIHLVDGRTLTFYYDAKGERILKRVANDQGKIFREIHYIRDEFGRSLVEREFTYIQPNQPPATVTTTFVYGPKGLAGFMRGDAFYSVITDHEGSIRLVVKGDEVVAAYDYLPYGNLMRKYGDNPEGHISYRYTGQEWDEETGLYNYHARFYDPSIGRFYQIDPKGQYFSPYKYAGNSPVSMIDPDGEFAFTLTTLAMIVCGIVGAYFGGASANSNWNPAKWDWKSGKTYLAIIGGGIGGAFLPAGIGSGGLIAGNVALGIANIYLSTAAANSEWDPSKWDVSSPNTWNAVFQGFAVGSGAVSGLKSAHNFCKGLSFFKKYAFIAGSGAYAVALFVINGHQNKWDINKPGLWYGIIDAVTNAPDLSFKLHDIGKFLKKNGRNFIPNIAAMARTFKTNGIRSGFKLDASKRVFQLLGGTSIALGSTLAWGAAFHDGFSWDMSTPDTYQALLTGFLTGTQLSSVGSAYYKNYKMSKKLSQQNKAKQMSLEAARDATSIYRRLNSPTDTEPNVRLENIPNAAISVVTTKQHILVAFSTHDAPDLLILYDNSKLSSPIMQGRTGLIMDKSIAGRPVTLSDNPTHNQEIQYALEKQKERFKQQNIHEFIDKDLNNILLLNEIGRTTRRKIVDSIKSDFLEQGFVTKDQILATLNTKIGLAHPRIYRTASDIRLLEHSKQEKLTQWEVSPTRKILAEIHEFTRMITRLKNRLQNIKREVITRTAENIYNYNMKKFWERFANPVDCAEVHAITALSRIDKIFPFVRKRYTDSDIQYLSTYTLEKYPYLEPVERCSNCRITTVHVRNVLTDPYWDNKIRTMEARQAKAKGVIDDQRYYILIPRLMSKQYTIETNETSTEISTVIEKDPKRDRRSIANHQKIHSINAASSAGKASSWMNRWFGWRTMEDRQTKAKELIDDQGYYILIPRLMSKQYTIEKNETSTEISTVVEKNPKRDRRSIANHQEIHSIIAASSAGKASSWMNRWFGWIESSAKELYTRATLHGETIRSMSHVSAPIDVNGTLMLLDVFARKLTGQKYECSIDQPAHLLEAQGQALNIIEHFETLLQQTALESGTSVLDLDINCVEIHKEITKKIMGSKYCEIPSLLRACVRKALAKNDENCENSNSFMYEFDKALNGTLEHLLPMF